MQNKIPRRASRYQPAGWLRGVVMGLDDGLVTTLVTVMALSSAAVTAHLFLVMVSVVLASAFSMALGGFASAKLSNDAYPVRQGLETGGAFIVGGCAPLIPVALNLSYMQWWSYICTALVALGFGALKAHYEEHESLLKSALFFLAIVTAGTLAGVAIGMVLQ